MSGETRQNAGICTIGVGNRIAAAHRGTALNAELGNVAWRTVGWNLHPKKRR